MIGGIGFMNWLPAWRVSRIVASTSSTCGSSTPARIVACDCLRKPPCECRRVTRYSLSVSASTSAPASSGWTIATTSFIPAGLYPRLPLCRSAEQGVHFAPDVFRDRRLVAIRRDHDEASRFGGGQTQVSVADADVEVGRIGLEPVPPRLRAPTRACEPDLDWYIEEKGAIGYERADRESGDLADRLKRSTVGVTRVADGRLEEPVGDDDLSRLERRVDHFANQLRARAAEEKDLRLGAQGDLARVQEDVTDALARRGAPRLSCEHDLATPLGQSIGKAARLERLP